MQQDLEAAKAQFLFQQGLLSELRELVSGLQADQQTKDQDSSSHQAAELHRTQDADASRSAAVTSLAQHLQAATLAQHLHMSDLRAQQQQNPFTALPDTHDTIHAADAASPHTELLGTNQHLLGVTAQQLRQLSFPSRKAAQRVHAALLPVLEQRLRKHAEAAAAAITGTKDDQGAAQAVQQTQTAVSQLQQANMQQLQQWQTEAVGYVQELEAIHEVLQQLVGSCMVEEQPKIAQAQREYAEATMQNCISKLHSMQLQLWCDTYDSKNVKALSLISQEQHKVEQELHEAIEQAESLLLEYTQLGAEFTQIVQEYADTKGKIREVDHVLHTLTQVEEEWQFQ